MYRKSKHILQSIISFEYSVVYENAEKWCTTTQATHVNTIRRIKNAIRMPGIEDKNAGAHSVPSDLGKCFTATLTKTEKLPNDSSVITICLAKLYVWRRP
jgi:hypothetical protein